MRERTDGTFRFVIVARFVLGALHVSFCGLYISDLVGILKIRHSRDVNYTLDAFREICHRQNMDDTYKKIVNSTT